MSTADCPEKPYNNLSYRRNLQTEIATLYGRDIAKETRRLEATRIKIQRRATDLDFLKRCRDTSVLPKFAIVKHQLRNHRNHRAFDRLGFAIVRGEIRRTRVNLNSLSNLALKLHLKLAHTLRDDLWTIVDACAALKADKEGCASRLKQNKKYL